jgi:alkanesulfonate monooxygenase
LLARKIATFDHLTGGRLAVHIITGKSDDEQHGDGDFSPKDERYRRAAEYLELMKLAWSKDEPFDFAAGWEAFAAAEIKFALDAAARRPQ